MTSQSSARPTPAYTPVVDRHLEPEVRLARLIDDVAARLRPVCRDMRPADFDVMVLHIARMKLRWAAAD